jgi:hypothetical protein
VGTERVTDMLAEFYFTHETLFAGPLDKQFTILTTNGEINQFAVCVSSALSMCLCISAYYTLTGSLMFDLSN